MNRVYPETPTRLLYPKASDIDEINSQSSANTKHSAHSPTIRITEMDQKDKDEDESDDHHHDCGGIKSPVSELSYQAKNQWVLGKLASFPAIDIKNEFVLSVSENGKGFVHTLKYNNRNTDLSGRRKKSAGHTVSTPSVRGSNRKSNLG